MEKYDELFSLIPLHLEVLLSLIFSCTLSAQILQLGNQLLNFVLVHGLGREWSQRFLSKSVNRNVFQFAGVWLFPDDEERTGNPQ